MNTALKLQDNLYVFRRGEKLIWNRGKSSQPVVYVEKTKHRMSKVINEEGFLMVVPSFELSHIETE